MLGDVVPIPPTMSRLRMRAFRTTRGSDEGVSMIEMMVALVLIAIVTAASATLFVGDIRGVDAQKQRQQAVYLADKALEQAHGLSPKLVGSTLRSGLVTGRSQANVNLLLATPAATRLHIAAQDDITTDLSLDYDPSGIGFGTLPVWNLNQSINGMKYNTYTFIDVCWETGSTSLNAGSTSTCGPTQTAGSTEDYRVSVDVAWTGTGSCKTGCDYSDATLIDPSLDNTFNANTSLPTFTISTPANSQVTIDNQVTTAACHIGSQTGQLITLIGNNLNSNAAVKISPGGGNIYNVLQPNAGTITFCLTTASTPGNYTLTVINTDFGLYKQPLTEEPYISTVASYNAVSHTVVVTGDGFESDATVACAGGASCTSQAPTSATSFLIPNYAGPTNGGTGTITISNPDDGTVTNVQTITAPNVTGVPVVIKGTTETGQVFNGTYFESGMTIAVTGGTPIPVLSAVSVSPGTASASLSATITTASTFSGTSFPFTVTNPDGGTDSTTVPVDAPPTITVTKTTLASPKKNTTLTVTVTGTNLSLSDTAGSFSTSWKLSGVTTVKPVTLVTGLSGTGATLTTTAPTTAGTYTLTVTVLNPDGGTATSATFTDVVTN
jgi:prepilin-type N-terminal cleavage/methylation domain-containing protein